MANPTRPVQDAIIDPVWGQWVHDALVDRQLQLLAKLAAPWTLPVDGVFATVVWPAPTINIGGNWQAASNAWKAPRAGYIEASTILRLSIASPGGSIAIGSVFVGATEYRLGQLNVGANQGWAISSSVPIAVAANDLVTAQVFVTAPGIAKTLNVGSQFSIRWLQ